MRGSCSAHVDAVQYIGDDEWRHRQRPDSSGPVRMMSREISDASHTHHIDDRRRARVLDGRLRRRIAEELRLDQERGIVRQSLGSRRGQVDGRFDTRRHSIGQEDGHDVRAQSVDNEGRIAGGWFHGVSPLQVRGRQDGRNGGRGAARGAQQVQDREVSARNARLRAIRKRAFDFSTTAALVIALTSAGASLLAQAPDSINLRGRLQSLRVHGDRGLGTPVIVSSGDGGWIHLGPHVAKLLAANGYFVVGFDTKAYLESFTSGSGAVRSDEVPADYRELVKYAAGNSGLKPILIGVSEGAGLSVLAASDPSIKPLIAGVVGLGLPDINELGWRWEDSVIYLTHGVPKEPTFSVAAIIHNMAPIPLADIQSTRDEFVPVAEAERLMELAGAPKRLWTIPAANHRFSDNLAELDRRVLEAIDWIRQNQVR